MTLLKTLPQAPVRTQSPCCYTAAMDDDTTWCDECGKPLIRCMAFEECGGLLDDNGLCTVCVAPQVQIAPGAITAARVGGAVALPMSIANASAVGRPLFITSVSTREGRAPWQEQDLGWERLNAGEQRLITIRADAFERAGVHDVECLVAVASRWRWREERFAFTTSLSFDVKEDSSAAGPVVNIGGDSAGHGNAVYIAGQNATDTRSERSSEALDLQLMRAEKEERKQGLRGMSESAWVPRGTTFSWNGFSGNDAPFEGPLLTVDGILAAGRSRSRRDGGLGDLRVLPETVDGKVDEDLGRLLSRRHFELYIECDRLILRVTGSGGVRINGEAYGRDKTVVLSDGDVISPIVQEPDLLRLTARFLTEHGRVSGVTFTRDVRGKKGGS